MNPITLIVTALAAGAAAAASAGASQAIKDAYAGLAASIAAAYPQVNAAALEADPGSRELQAYVQKQLVEAGAGQDVQLLEQAQALLKSIQAQAPEVAGKVGVNLAGVIAAGDIHIHDIHIGDKIIQAPAKPVALTAPAPPDTFAGRVAELQELTAILLSNGNAAISAATAGMGGIGKTTVAQKLGADLAAHFPGGVLWLTVGFNATRADLVDRLALQLAVDLAQEQRIERRAAILGATLAQRGRILAVLDDVWDVDLGRWAIDNLLPPERALLVTSRNAGLCRTLCHHVQRLDALSEEEALQLFTNILGELGPHVAAAQQINAVIEGLPLALELAARLCDNGPADLPWLLRQLQDKPVLGILKLEGEEVREASVEACLKLSYDGLDADLRRRFRALGVFARAPFDLAALAAVWADDGLEDAEKAARQLQRRGFLRRAEDRLPYADALPYPVFAQHGLLRAYALALLQGEGQQNDMAERHAGYFEHLPGREAENWQVAEPWWAQIEHAWLWAVGAGPSRALAFYYALRVYLNLRGRHPTQIDWVLAILAAGEDVGISLKDRGTLLNNVAWVYSALGDKQQALAYYEQALPLYRQVGDRSGEAGTLNNIGRVYDDLGDKQQALAYYEQALPLFRQVGDRAGEATTLNNIGGVYDDLGDMQQALLYYEQALPLSRQVGNRGGEARTLNNIGGVYDALGDKQQALRYFEQALPLFRQVGDRGGEATTLNNIGGVYDALGDKQQALRYYEQALPLRRQVGDRGGEATTLNNMAVIYFQQGQPERTVEMLRQALDLDRAVGAVAQEAGHSYNLAYAFHHALGQTTEAVQLLDHSVDLLQRYGLPQDAAGATLAQHQALLQQLQAALPSGPHQPKRS